MKSPGRLPIQDPRHPFNPTVALQNSTIKCPRKGPFTETITADTCIQMNKRDSGACAAYRCSAYENAAKISARLKALTAVPTGDA